MAQDIIQEYIKTHSGSMQWHERAKKVFAASGATHIQRYLEPFRPYITHAKGTRKWDVDGHEYIDYVMGHGALILGHGHPAVIKAVQEQVVRGVHYGEPHQMEVEWAELIKSMMPSIERIEFFSSGMEANLMALRIARAYTGRKRVLRFVENFHGWADELVAPAPGAVADNVTVIPGHDLLRLEKELATKEYAIVLVEGGGAHLAGQIPWETEFIRALAGMTKKYGTLLLIDEVVTGFRDSRGGWQSSVGITPDLTSLGKTIGGGLGVGALGGRADVMDVLRPRAAPGVFIQHSGTWNANPLTAAAGIAACKLYLDGNVQNTANELGAYFRKKGNQTLKELGISGRFYGKSIIWIYLGPIDYEPADDVLPPTRDAGKLLAGASGKPLLCVHLLQRGISTMGARFFILSAVHTEKDIDQTIAALRDSLVTMLKDGSLKK